MTSYETPDGGVEQPFVLGGYRICVEGTQSGTVTAVTLAEAHGVELETWTVRLPESEFLGAAEGSLVDNDIIPGVDTVSVPCDTDGPLGELLVQVSRTDPEVGWFDGYDIAWEAGGHTGVILYRTALTLCDASLYTNEEACPDPPE
ncbi:MAG: hypothetical protein LBR19_05375 [Bifidobacteriaceae bacterium]|nr:hypothetical protein [Bifidobacteriaceae bacterium]